MLGNTVRNNMEENKHHCKGKDNCGDHNDADCELLGDIKRKYGNNHHKSCVLPSSSSSFGRNFLLPQKMKTNQKDDEMMQKESKKNKRVQTEEAMSYKKSRIKYM